MLVAAGFLGLAAQGAKIAVDTIVQRDTDDAFRGRAFALYDVLYNAAFVGAAALGAVTLPDTGYSQGLFLVLAVAYAGFAALYGSASRGVPAARSPQARSAVVSSDDKVVGRQDDLPLNAVLGSDLALSHLGRRSATTTRWSGSTARSPGSPATRPTRSSAATAGSCRARRPTRSRWRASGPPSTSSRAVATVIRNYRRDGTPFWNQVVISPVVDEAGRVTHHIGIQVDVTDRVESDRARDLEIDVPHQATARLDLLARISDELAQHLEYDDAVDALGDIAIPALATWGFVAVTDDRGRFDRIHLVAADPDDRETAPRARERGHQLALARAQGHRGAHQRPGLRRDAVRGRRGRPARPDHARAARPAAPARARQRDGGPAAGARPRPRRADPRAPSTGSPPTPW